jgi:hypothetical protein
MEMLEKKLETFRSDLQKSQEKKLEEVKTALETQLSMTFTSILENNMAKINELMATNNNAIKSTIQSVLTGGSPQGESGLTQTALGLGRVEHGSASDADDK